MRLEIVERNYHASERLQQILQQKVKKLDKYFPDNDTVAKVVMTDLGRQCKMELSINYHGLTIRSEVTGDTMYYNVDECLPKVERQIIKHRGKLNDKKKMPAQDSDYQFVSEVEVEPIKIAKVKKFGVTSMSAEEAAENLELVGHDFYVFVNSSTDNVEVVYRRKDGTIGLLQPYEE